MSTGYAMIDQPNRNYTQGQRYRRNGGKVSGTIVVHSFENVPDTNLPDLGAENGLRYLRTRTSPGCYHGLSDSDSRIPLYPYDWETWHCRFTNNWSVGFCMATRASAWPSLTDTYIHNMLYQNAAMVADFIVWAKAERKIIVPIRWLDRGAAMRRAPGLITHGRIGHLPDQEGTDPERRTDPGPAFGATYRNRYLEMVGDLSHSVTIPGGPVGGQHSAPVATIPPFPGTVRLGSRGEIVRAVQQRLHDRGGWFIHVDGYFGPKTDRVVRAFQRLFGLYVDGIVGPITWRALWERPIK